MDWVEAGSIVAQLAHEPLPEAGVFRVHRLPKNGPGWIGRGHDGSTALLLRVIQHGASPYPIKLPAIRASHAVNVRIEDEVGEKEATVSVIELLPSDAGALDVFLRCFGSIIPDDAESVPSGEIAQALIRLLELFRAGSHATDSEVLGLWGELLVLALSPDAGSLIKMWRADPGARFDFGSDFERVDVKTTTGRLRVHEVSFDQTNPPPSTAAAFVSIMTERVASGTTVRHLWTKVLERAPQHAEQIDATCVETLGRDWALVRDIAFDLPRALTTIRVFEATCVPRLTTTMPGVSRIRFASDFGQAPGWLHAPPTGEGPIAAIIGAVAESLRRLQGSDPL